MEVESHPQSGGFLSCLFEGGRGQMVGLSFQKQYVKNSCFDKQTKVSIMLADDVTPSEHNTWRHTYKHNVNADAQIQSDQSAVSSC